MPEGPPPEFALRDLIADGIPTDLTATPHVGIGGARRAKIANAVLAALDDNGLTVVPEEVLNQLVQVAGYVSRGRSFVDVGPYPDATARMALGALDEATQRYPHHRRTER